MHPWHIRSGIFFALLFLSSPLWSQAPDTTSIKPAFFKGLVVPNKDKSAFALMGDDAELYPLIKDQGSLMFSLDPQLLRRPMRLTAKLLPDGRLQVVNVHSYKKGILHDVYYWCDICTIKGYQLTICDCCGDPMEFRETPAK